MWLRRRVSAVDVGALRAALAERLPDYMVPAALVVLERLPLTPNGKLDRRALPAPEPVAAAALRGPRTPQEEVLCALFAEVLGVARVGIDDNFFALGGDSIMSIQLVSRARLAGLVITPRAVFQHKTVEALAGAAKFAEPADAARPDIARDVALVSLSQGEIERLEGEYRGIEDILPLSPLQGGLLFHALYDAQALDVYTVQLVLRLEGALDAAVLEASAQAVVQRHSSLRAAFRHEGLSRPVQVIVPSVAAPWRSLDLSGLDAGKRERRLADLLEQERVARFDLTCPPLLRFALLRLSAVEHRLVLCSHHLVSDGWSTPVLVQELLTLYAHNGDAGALGRVTPYRDYLSWLSRQDRAAARAAWQEALRGLEEATHVAAPDATRAARVPEQLTVSLEAGLSAGLVEQGRRQGVTLNTILQVAWAILLGRLTSRDDVVFGVTVAGRPPELAGIERMVGLFINTLPLRVRLAPSTPLLELLKQVQESQSRLMAHQHLGLSEIQGLAGLGELFDTLVVFENYPVALAADAGPFGGVRLAGISGQDATHYPLVLTALPGERLTLRLSYRSDLFDRADVEVMAERLIRLLEAAVAEPGRAIGSLDILAPAERETLLRGWNDTVHAIPAATLPELFAAQAERTPDAAAVVFADATLSYRELDERANRLAHHLRGRGVGPEVVVGLCLERSPEMVIGLLAILKAGGAYLPLDPAYPRERLAFMLEDAGAPVLVTHSGLAARLPSHRAATVRVDADAAAIAAEPASAPALTLDPHNPAYVIYTSGSTGTPKGVVVAHQGLHNYTTWAIQTYPLDSGSGAPLLTPLAFDATVTSLFLPILSGRAVLLLDEDQQLQILSAQHPNFSNFSLLKLTPTQLDVLKSVNANPGTQGHCALPRHRRRDVERVDDRTLV